MEQRGSDQLDEVQFLLCFNEAIDSEVGENVKEVGEDEDSQ